MDDLDADNLEGALDEAVDAERPRALASWSFARKIVPVFELVRAIFSQKKLDTALKLMLLYELTQIRGRFDKKHIRSATHDLPESRVDRLADALYRGGWLELRASDQTYQLNSTGLQLLAVLHAADLTNLSPDNVLSRAAQNAEFGGHARRRRTDDRLPARPVARPAPTPGRRCQKGPPEGPGVPAH